MDREHHAPAPARPLPKGDEPAGDARPAAHDHEMSRAAAASP